VLGVEAVGGVVAVLSVIAILACVIGDVWGPVLLGFVFAGSGALLLFGGSPGPLLGLAYLSGSAAEFAAAKKYQESRRSGQRPPLRWTALSTLVGIAGVVGVALLAYAFLVVMAWVSSF
jgi:hypothetical protein